MGADERKHKQEEKSAGWAVLCIFGVLFLTWGAYLMVAVALLLGHLPWLLAHEQPLNKPLARLCVVALTPLCVVLALFPRTRLFAGMGFFLTSGLLTFVTCAACAMYVYYHWSWWGLTLGTALIGYGIIPVAAVCAGVSHQWGQALQIISGGILLFSCLYVGLALMTLAFSTDPIRADNPHDETVEG